MAAAWQRILTNSALGAVLGGVIGGVVMQNTEMAQMDVRNTDHGEGVFARAQDNDRLLRLVVDLSVLRKKAAKDFNEMHRKLGRLLHLEENLAVVPKRASWTQVATFYSLDVRDACKRLVKHIVKEMKCDKHAYPKAMEFVEALKKIATQAKDSAYNIEQNNLQLFAV
jgi:hypothetical protein